jgi:hypothetical protein
VRYRIILPLLLLLMAGCRPESGGDAKEGLQTKTGRRSKSPAFAEYPIPSNEIYRDAPEAPDPSTNPMARRYRTAIEQGVRKGVNFAGHYVLVSWGCGTSCQQSAVVDAITGRVYPGPESSYGYAFKTDSRLLITNPPDPGRIIDSGAAAARTEYWLWQTGGLRRIEE